MRSLLANPVPLAAIVVLVVNDHWAKAAYPGLVTGKLSDFAGMVFFPLFVVAAVELVLGRTWRSRATVFAVTVVCLAVFAAIKLSPAAGNVWATALGHAQWIAYATWSTVLGDPIAASTPVAHTVDPTDLLAAIPGAGVAVASVQPMTSASSELR
jgi:hypothetical protein